MRSARVDPDQQFGSTDDSDTQGGREMDYELIRLVRIRSIKCEIKMTWLRCLHVSERGQAR